MDIDGAPGVAVKAGVEQSRGILERSALGEGELHGALVGLAGADHSIVIPNRNAPPFPLLDHLRDSLFDQRADMGERLAPPIAQFLDPCVDQPGGRLGVAGFARLHFVCTSFAWFCVLRRFRPPINRKAAWQVA
jgi:hypothetical protein